MQNRKELYTCINDMNVPLLASVAKSILAITATSVPSECLFSQSETNKRNLSTNWVNPSRLGKLTFLKTNMLVNTKISIYL